MDDREELRRLIDVIEKGSGSGSFEQALDDIKTFANTASFLACLTSEPMGPNSVI